MLHLHIKYRENPSCGFSIMVDRWISCSDERTDEWTNERTNERTDEPGIDAAWARRLKMHTPVSWWEMIASSSLSCSPAGKHEQIMFTWMHNYRLSSNTEETKSTLNVLLTIFNAIYLHICTYMGYGSCQKVVNSTFKDCDMCAIIKYIKW